MSFFKAQLCLHTIDAQTDTIGRTRPRSSIFFLPVIHIPLLPVSHSPSSIQNDLTQSSNVYCLALSAFLHH